MAERVWLGQMRTSWYVRAWKGVTNKGETLSRSWTQGMMLRGLQWMYSS